MLLLDFFLIVIQFLIVEKVLTSTIWQADRQLLGSIKILYCCIGISAILALIPICVTAFSSTMSRQEHIIFFTLMLLYSFIEYQAVAIFNQRRIDNSAIQRPGIS